MKARSERQLRFPPYAIPPIRATCWRTRAGLQAARAQGRHGGRRPKLTPVQRGEIVDMVLSGRKTAADVARLFGIHPATVSRLISRARRLTYDSEQTLR